ncbi:hypothetical protein CIB48_g2491 [Xylaria polymorpha]|nr:hypothetical protein CIB48_g2491 [Xylaria polymorpha]
MYSVQEIIQAVLVSVLVLNVAARGRAERNGTAAPASTSSFAENGALDENEDGSGDEDGFEMVEKTELD